MEYTINVNGQLLDLQRPLVMGILNATPDSFYEVSRMRSGEDAARRAIQIISEGGTIIDIGACSTRPGSEPVGEDEEMSRLRVALSAVRDVLPDAIISVDTFRSSVAQMAIEEFHVAIINDVSASEEMMRLSASKGVPYILMSSESDFRQALMFFSEKVQRMREMGQKDIILDPGFGFGKTLQQNYELMSQLDKLQVLDLPFLVGISRKSMIWKFLGTTPNDALSGTTVLNAIALQKGASILRVHDVKVAVDVVKMVSAVG